MESILLMYTGESRGGCGREDNMDRPQNGPKKQQLYTNEHQKKRGDGND